MTLSCNKRFSGNGYGKGVFISAVKIVDARDVSGETLPYMERPFDIAVKFTLDIGREFQPEMVIGGELKRDTHSNEVIGWGSAFLVQDMLARLGYTGDLKEGNKLPEEAVSGLIGKEFYRLSYVSRIKDNGKIGYSDWNQIAALDEGADGLATRFKKSLTRGYPRNYRPELMDVTPATIPIADEDPF